jgi:hypothetical protein
VIDRPTLSSGTILYLFAAAGVKFISSVNAHL